MPVTLGVSGVGDGVIAPGYEWMVWFWLVAGSGLGTYLTVRLGCWAARELGLVDDVWRWLN